MAVLQVDTSTIKPAEWERLRTGIALKTFTALMKRSVDKHTPCCRGGTGHTRTTALH